jgi:acetyl esterase/lipase
LASPFINQGYTFAAIGYRTYPDADCIDQSNDVKEAIQSIQKHLNTEGKEARDYTLMAHSSGCHICALGFTKGIFDSSLKIDRFVSMAGVFDIPQHYRWEMARGVARFSPMARACRRMNNNGKSLDQQTQIDPVRTLAGWRDNSPIYDVVSNKDSVRFPGKCYVLHGTKDTTCPYNYSQEFGNALKGHRDSPSLVDVDVIDTGHAEMVLELMFGGLTRDAVLNWLEGTSSTNVEN